MSSKNIVEDLRIMARVVAESQGGATVTMLSGSLFDDAADEIERLSDEIKRLRSVVVLCPRCLTAGISQDISNAEDELEDARLAIERLRDAGDHLAASIRTGRWDDALDAWDDIRGGDAS